MNENQKVVLDWFKEQYATTSDYPIETLQLSGMDIKPMPENVRSAYESFSEKEEFGVLLEFAKWGIKR